MTTTLDRLRSLLQEKFDIAPDAVDASAPIQESGLDSLALAELLFDVEDRFGVQLQDDARTVRSLADLVDLVDRRLASAAPQRS